ncbi:MAG: fibro-slime domain-containing protein [Kovacikia sp.]
MDPRDEELQAFPFNAGYGVVKGIVQTTLTNGKPVYAGTTKIWNHGQEAFEKWFSNSHPGDATQVGYILTLQRTPQNTYVLDSDGDEPFKSIGGFFPIDGRLLGNYADTGHNFHFTMEAHTEFTYQRGQTFTFRGDDDLWVFINQKLVIDLGGVHAAETATVHLDTLGLTPGQTYSLDLFFAERHTTQSNFRIETSIVLRPAIVASITATRPDAHKIGPVAGEFTITLAQPAPAGGIVVTYGINEVAPNPPLTRSVEGTDFTLQPAGRSITIPEGQSNVKIQVNPQGQPPLGSSSGAVVANLKPGLGYQLDNNSASAIVRITDQVVIPTVSITAGPDVHRPGRNTLFGSQKEKSSFTISRTGEHSDQPLEVDLSLSGQATLNDDYEMKTLNDNDERIDWVPPKVTFRPGQTSLTLEVDPRNVPESKNVDAPVVATIQENVGKYRIGDKNPVSLQLLASR